MSWYYARSAIGYARANTPGRRMTTTGLAARTFPQPPLFLIFDADMREMILPGLY